MKSIRRTARAASRRSGKPGRRATTLGLEALEPRCMFNAAPVALGLADLSATEDSPAWSVDLSAGFSDSDGDPLTYSLVGVSGSSLFSNIQLNAQTGQLHLPPAANANGTALLTFQAMDPSGATASLSFQATLAPVNDAPYIGSPLSADVGRNGYFSIPIGNCDSIYVGDVDAGYLEVTLSATNGSLAGSLPGGLSVLTGALGTAGLTVGGSAGSINALLTGLRFVPTTDYIGSASFSLFVTDLGASGAGGTLTASRTLSFNVIDSDPSGAPVAVDDQYCLTEDVVLSVPTASGVLRNDARTLGDALTAQLVDDVGHGQLTFNSDGSFSYLADQDYFGPDFFTYLVKGGDGAGTIGRVDLNVRNVNDAPVAFGDSYGVDEDQTLIVSVGLGLRANDVDVDFDTLSTYVQSGPSHGQLFLNTNGLFTYVPHANYFGTDSFTYRVYDPYGASSLGTVLIDVHSGNDLPSATNDHAETNPGQAVTIDLTANDSDLETPVASLTWEVAAAPSLGTVAMDVDGKAVYTPAVGQTTDVSFTYRVQDADGGWSDPATVSIHLNVAPAAVPPVETPLANTGGPLSLSLAALFSDPEGQGLSYSISSTSLPGALTDLVVDDGTGLLSFTPVGDVYGTIWVTVVATDPLGLTQTTLLPITLLEATPHADLGSALDLGALPVDPSPTPLSQNGLLNDHRGQSYYRFTLDAAAVVDFAVAAERLGSALDARLTLYAADGTKLATSSDAVGLDPEIRKELAAGSYYFVVEAEGFQTGNFQLVGQATPAGQAAPPLALPGIADAVLEKAASTLQAATSAVEYLTGSEGALLGVRITIGLTQPLDALRALLPQAFSLIGAGADGVFHTADDVIADASLSNALLSTLDLIPGVSQTLTLTAALSPTAQAGDYVLTWRPGLLSTLGGQVLSSVGLATADVLASFTFRADPPTVVSTTAAAFFELDTPNRIVVQYAHLSDSAQQPGSAAAGLPATYQLERRTATGWEAMNVTAVSYTPLNQQAVLSGFGSLAAGEYRLTILADGLANARGLELDGDGNGAAGGDFVQTFTVVAPTGTVDRPNAALLDGTTALLDSTRQFLDAAVQAGGKGLASVASAASLLQAAFGAILGGGTADAIQTAVSAAFSARLAALAIPPNEYMVVWSLDARFLLKALEDAGLPADQQRIVGRDGSGLSFSAAGTGGVYLSLTLPLGAGSVDLALAIVPLDSHQDFFSRPGLTRADGGSSTPDLRWSLETEGGGSLSSLGVLYFGNNGLAGGSVQTNLGAGSVAATLAPPPSITGFDTQTGAMGTVLRDAVQTLAGDLSQRSTPTLILWFDPVDFVLEDASGGKSGSGPGGPSTQPANSYYSGNGSTELLVFAGAKEDSYKLALTGLDSGYRGGIDYWSGTARQSFEYQGTLPSSEGVAALLDFRRAATFDFASFGSGADALVFNTANSANGFTIYSIPSLFLAAQGAVGGLVSAGPPGSTSPHSAAAGPGDAAEQLQRLIDETLASLLSDQGGLATSLEGAALAARMRVSGWWTRFRIGASRAAASIPGPTIGWGTAVDAAFSWFESQAEDAESEVRDWLKPSGDSAPAAGAAPAEPRSDAGSARHEAAPAHEEAADARIAAAAARWAASVAGAGSRG